MQRLIPEKYKMRLGDAVIDMKEVDINIHLHPDTLLLKEPGLYCFLLRCKRHEAELFMEWAVETVLPHAVRKLASATEKDAACALLNNDLQERDNQIQATKYENVALQAQRYVYQAQLQRCQDQICDLIINHVPRASDPGRDNIVMTFEKNTNPEEDQFYEYPYYIARIQRQFISTKRRWFRAQYPHYRFIIEELDNANSIYAFNRLEEGPVERFQCHFGLVDLACDALYAFATPTIRD